jgi:lipoprotein-anchoring transpeptidase ErfK/SrfK
MTGRLSGVFAKYAICAAVLAAATVVFGVPPVEAARNQDPARPVVIWGAAEYAERTDARAAPEPRDPTAYSRQVVKMETPQPPGSILIDTEHRFLYLVQDGGTAIRYGVGVGRPGFEWAGTNKVSRKEEWPDWVPPEEMRARQPFLPAYLPGGLDNPLGARAIYIGATLYRIHGTNEATTIGEAVSSGCIRMLNEDVIDLYNRVDIGAKVVVF